MIALNFFFLTVSLPVLHLCCLENVNMSLTCTCKMSNFNFNHGNQNPLALLHVYLFKIVSVFVISRSSVVHFTVTLANDRLDKFRYAVAVSSKRIKLQADSWYFQSANNQWKTVFITRTKDRDNEIKVVFR